jgi:hypothetical protein
MKTNLSRILQEYINVYINILESYYPAKRSIGFTERNQTVNFSKAIEKVYPFAFTWFEVPFEDDSKNHFDAIVIIPEVKEIFIIEAKRFSDGNSKVVSVGKDIKRIENYNYISGAIETLKDSNQYSIYGVLLADLWTENSIKNKISDKWCLGPDNFFTDELFTKKLNINKAFVDSIECMERITIGDYVNTDPSFKNYNLLICIWKTAKVHRLLK